MGKFKIIEREYPAQIRIYGEAYYLIRVIYKAQERKLYSSLYSFFFGNMYTEIAKNLGARFGDYLSNLDDKTTEDIKYIHSYYLLIANDTGSSATLHYSDAFSIDNPYWEPKSLY